MIIGDDELEQISNKIVCPYCENEIDLDEVFEVEVCLCSLCSAIGFSRCQCFECGVKECKYRETGKCKLEEETT
jgi:hypothetical protein